MNSPVQSTVTDQGGAAAERPGQAAARATEDALRESEERFRALVEGFAQAVWELDASGRLVTDSPSWRAHTGQTFAQSMGCGWVDAIHPEDHAEALGGWQRALAERHAVNAEYRVRTADGHWRWTNLRAAPLFGQDGSLRKWVGMAIDIDERHRAQLALRESEANQAFVLKLADMLRSLSDACQVEATACPMLCEYIHADRVAFADIEGDDYLLRYSYDKGMPPLARHGRIADFGAALAPAYRSGNPVAVEDVAADPRFSEDEREHLLAQGIGSFAGIMLNKDGHWVGALGVQCKHARAWTKGELDLTREVGDRIWSAAQRARAETALRESEALFRALADASPALIWQIDAVGNALYLNQRYVEVTGLSREQLLGKGWHQVLHPDDREAYVAATEAALRERRPYQLRVRARFRDGAWHWFETHAAPRFSADGEYRGHVGISIDITEEVSAEESLREADRRKDEFLATLAHELRNPLAPISNAVHLLRHPEGRRRADKIVEMVGRQVRHIVRLVDDLMEVSRITRGKIELEKQPVALADIIQAAVETSQPAIEQGRHQIDVALPDQPLRVNGDKVRLTQVFTNLLNNAAKYTNRGGQIRLSARREGGWAVVEVLDNGVGIAPDQLPHVFEMFVQGHRTEGRGQGGLGIGLTMVRNLVQMHGGQVEAHSAGLGQGSKFVVRLPLLARADDREAGAPRAGAGAPLAGKRILIVDDNRDAADSLSLLLESKGAQVATAYDGRSGLAAVAANRPDAVVLDIGMPGMDGYEVARRIREDLRLPSVRIIALTGWGQQADRQASRNSGFDHHLTKPVDLMLLQRLLAE
ncbi:MAG: PAS domain S-box protein [Massilia sp.]